MYTCIYLYIYAYALYTVTLMTRKMLPFNPVASFLTNTPIHISRNQNIPFPEVSKLNEELSEQ